MKLLKNRTVQNAGWLIMGRVVHVLLSFVIGLLSARYLGPSNYGLINYATAYTTFFTAFCTLGINSVLVKNFIDNPQEEGQAIGTTLILRLVSSVLSLITIAGIVRLIDGNDKVALTVVTLYSLGLVFHIFDTFNYWFQSKLLSKYYAIATLISYIVASFYRLLLLILGKSVEWFAIANSVDHFILSLLLVIFYKMNHGPKLSFSFRKAKQLLSVSCSYILSGLMVAVYGATDKLMLKQMLNESAVGFYALATTISNMWVFILSAIIDSLKPTIMRDHNENKQKYELGNRKLYAIIFYLSVLASVGISIIAPLFISIVYGKAYLPAVTPLRIVVWYVAFSYLGVARDIWIICERKQKYLKYIYIGSAGANVLLNLIFIPLLGASGAAIASLLTQISTIFVFPLFFKDFRPNVKIVLDAIRLKGLLKREKQYTVVTAGPTYLDIDAYACSVALAELLNLKGENAYAFSKAPCNYSVCESLIVDGQIYNALPSGATPENTKYIIVDISDPEFLKTSVPLDRVYKVYDHHTGFEEYWENRIGEGAKIEFIGAAATLIYLEWKKAGYLEQLSRTTALLLLAAILDNTLNLTSSNTTDEDIMAYNDLRERAGVNEEWCAAYFTEVQNKVEADLKNAIFGDIKTVFDNKILPRKVAQLCVWDASSILEKLPLISSWFEETGEEWMINIIDIKQNCSYFVCDNVYYQEKIAKCFNVQFNDGIAKTNTSYLRKQIIKQTLD